MLHPRQYLDAGMAMLLTMDWPVPVDLIAPLNSKGQAMDKSWPDKGQWWRKSAVE